MIYCCQKFQSRFYLIKSKLTNFDYSSIENLKNFSNFRDLAQEI